KRRQRETACIDAVRGFAAELQHIAVLARPVAVRRTRKNDAAVRFQAAPAIEKAGAQRHGINAGGTIKADMAAREICAAVAGGNAQGAAFKSAFQTDMRGFRQRILNTEGEARTVAPGRSRRAAGGARSPVAAALRPDRPARFAVRVQA